MVMRFIFDTLVGAPVTLGKQVLEKIRDEVDRERLITEDSVIEKLKELQMLLEEKEITEEEYDELEAKLMERLKAIRKYQGGE
jgi:predicted DNA-binding protein (UPF0278 family)